MKTNEGSKSLSGARTDKKIPASGGMTGKASNSEQKSVSRSVPASATQAGHRQVNPGSKK